VVHDDHHDHLIDLGPYSHFTPPTRLNLSAQFISLYAEHIPTEFEDTTHYLRATDGTDIEPLHKMPEVPVPEKVRHVGLVVIQYSVFGHRREEARPKARGRGRTPRAHTSSPRCPPRELTNHPSMYPRCPPPAGDPTSVPYLPPYLLPRILPRSRGVL